MMSDETVELMELFSAQRQFTAYGPSHWAVICVFAVGSVLLVWVGRSQTEPQARRLGRILGALTAAIFAFVLVYSLLPPTIGRSVPLNLTDLATAAAICAFWSQRHWAFALTYYWGLVLSTQALISPVLTGPDFPNYNFLGFWGIHVLVVWAAIYLTWGRRMRPQWRSYRFVVVVTLIWAATAFTFNSIAGTDYGFLNGKPRTPSLLDLMGPWPVYVLIAAAVVLIVWALMTWPWERRRGAITRCMAGAEHLITHVSDTARWTALHRATESARADALFSDPLAERLAGERGRAIVAGVPRMTRNGWWLVARTKIIDDVVAEAIDDGCDRVLNLAAGLDTRPYRLDLPADFDWVEADLPQLLAEKAQLLADHQPRCRLTRSAVDLADPSARAAFLNRALAGATKALVLTEGLLMYLEDRDVVALSQAMKRPEVAWWMLDFAGPGLKKMMNKKMAGMLQNAPFKFAPENGVAYFEQLGWRTVEVESLLVAARRLHRLPISMRAVAWLPQPNPRHPGTRRWSAAALLTH